MAVRGGWVKVARKLLDWRWYKDSNTMRVFLHLLLSANVEDHDFQHVTIHRGQVATSYEALANALGLSVQNVRTAIAHLKSTGELTGKAYSKFQVLTIVAWDLYQCELTGKLTGNQQATNNNQRSEEIKKGSVPPKRKRFTPPTVEDVKAYCTERGNHVDADRFVDFYTANGWTQGRGKPIKDWRACVRTWERSDRVAQKTEGVTAYDREL